MSPHWQSTQSHFGFEHIIFSYQGWIYIYAEKVEPEPETIVATYGPDTESPILATGIPSANYTPDPETIALVCPNPHKHKTESPILATGIPSANVDPEPAMIIPPTPGFGYFGCPARQSPIVVSPILATAGIYLPCL